MDPGELPDRRVSPVAGHPGEGLLTEPTADARACRLRRARKAGKFDTGAADKLSATAPMADK